MLTPPFLRPGDTIALAATARSATADQLNFACTYFENKGFKIILSSNIGKVFHQYGGNDIERAKAFQELLDAPGISAIVCVRGGYGSVRMIDQVDLVGFRRYPKWVVGFSDATVLHARLHSMGTASLHAEMALRISDDPDARYSADQMILALTGDYTPYELSPHPMNVSGTEVLHAPLVGGNLSVLYSLLGSRDFPSLHGKILFLEDVDEYLYHIDRMMYALRRAGKFEGLAGMVIGDMSDMKDNEVPFGHTVEEIILDSVKHYPFPVWFGAKSGHERLNLPLFLGKEVERSLLLP
jgi:muramoyltetrapeptide carboxypeptidase